MDTVHEQLVSEHLTGAMQELWQQLVVFSWAEVAIAVLFLWVTALFVCTPRGRRVTERGAQTLPCAGAGNALTLQRQKQQAAAGPGRTLRSRLVKSTPAVPTGYDDFDRYGAPVSQTPVSTQLHQPATASSSALLDESPDPFSVFDYSGQGADPGDFYTVDQDM